MRTGLLPSAGVLRLARHRRQPTTTCFSRPPPPARKTRVTFIYSWGHPFEHELFDAPQPESVIVRSPDGKTEDVTKKARKDRGAGQGQEGVGWRLTYTPTQRGDYVVVLKTKPILLEERRRVRAGHTVKVVYHVQAQKGWDGW